MDEQLEGLKEAVGRLLQRQEELEVRIRSLEGERSGIGSQPPPLETSPPPLPAWPPFVQVPVPPQAPVPPVPQSFQPNPTAWRPPAPQPITAKPGFEATFGLNWINRIAVVTLLLGAAFLFKYGADNGWFGPVARMVIGLVSSAVAVLAGERLWRRGQTTFAAGLTGLGSALSYLSFYAGSSLYHLLPHGLAFGLMIATTAGTVFLATRYESQVIAVLAMLGGYLTPAALSTGGDHPRILFSYLFLLNLGGLGLAKGRTKKPRKWLALEWLALAATVIFYGDWFASWLSDANRPVGTLFAILFYAQFAAAESAGVWATVQFGAPWTVAGIWDQEARFLPWDVLFVVGGLTVADLRKSAAGPLWTLGCYWFPLWLWAQHGRQPADRGIAFAWIGAAFVAFFLWIPFSNWVRKREIRLTDLLMLAANAGAYFAAGYFLLDAEHHAYMGLFAVAVGGLHLALAWMLRESDARMLALGVAVAFAALAVPLQFSGFVITIAWALEGAALAWVASRMPLGHVGGDWARAGTAALFALVIERLTVIDAWMYPDATRYSAIVNARFEAFAVSAASLWVAARSTAALSIAARSERRPWALPSAAVAYVTGHIVLLIGLGLELDGWVDRFAAAADRISLLAISSSMLIAVYAVVLLTAGVLTRTAINRLIGLGLVSLVIAKLYLIDVWQLSRISRITAFLALGGLLLAVSYLYSRFKPSIERLWKADTRA